MTSVAAPCPDLKPSAAGCFPGLLFENGLGHFGIYNYGIVLKVKFDSPLLKAIDPNDDVFGQARNDHEFIRHPDVVVVKINHNPVFDFQVLIDSSCGNFQRLPKFFQIGNLGSAFGVMQEKEAPESNKA